MLSISVVKGKEILFAYAERYSRVKNDKLLNSGLIQDALKWGEPDNIYWFENPLWKATRRMFVAQNKWWTNPKDYFTMVGYEPPCKIKWGSHHKSHMPLDTIQVRLVKALLLLLMRLVNGLPYQYGRMKK